MQDGSEAVLLCSTTTRDIILNYPIKQVKMIVLQPATHAVPLKHRPDPQVQTLI